MNSKEFFTFYSKEAIESMIATGIPASVTLAQAAIESAYGNACYQFNFFGIKANKNWTGRTQLLTTTEILPWDSQDTLAKEKNGFKFPEVLLITAYSDGKFKWNVKDYFRAYDSAKDGFTDHANFFIVNPRYRDAIKYKTDAEQFAMKIAAAGYATGLDYGQTIIEIIKKNELLAYDKEAYRLASS